MSGTEFEKDTTGRPGPQINPPGTALGQPGMTPRLSQLDCSERGSSDLGLDESFAKFVSKFAMLSIFPFREISCEICYAVRFPSAKIYRNSPPWGGMRVRNAPRRAEAGEKKTRLFRAHSSPVTTRLRGCMVANPSTPRSADQSRGARHRRIYGSVSQLRA